MKRPGRLGDRWILDQMQEPLNALESPSELEDGSDPSRTRGRLAAAMQGVAALGGKAGLHPVSSRDATERIAVHAQVGGNVN